MLASKLAPSASKRPIESYFRDEVRGSARGNWHMIATRCGIPSEMLTGLRSACPSCGSEYFKFLDERGHGSYVCRASGRADATGDGFALLRHVFGLEFGQAVRMAAQVMRVPEYAPRAREGRAIRDRASGARSVAASLRTN